MRVKTMCIRNRENLKSLKIFCLKHSEVRVRIILIILLFWILTYMNVKFEYIISLLVVMIPEIFNANERDKQRMKDMGNQSAVYFLVSQNIYLEFSYLYDLYELILRDNGKKLQIKVKNFSSEYTRSILHKLNIEFSEIINVFLISLETEYTNAKMIIENHQNNIYSKEQLLSRKNAIYNLVTEIEKKDFNNNYQPISLEEEILFFRELLKKYREETRSAQHSMKW